MLRNVKSVVRFLVIHLALEIVNCVCHLSSLIFSSLALVHFLNEMYGCKRMNHFLAFNRFHSSSGRLLVSGGDYGFR